MAWSDPADIAKSRLERISSLLDEAKTAEGIIVDHLRTLVKRPMES